MKINHKIMNTAATIVLLISIILNIALLCTDVFHGTYKFSDDEYDYEIIFFDNTYSSNTYIKYNHSSLAGSFHAGDLVSSGFGFYQYIPKAKYNDAEYNTIILESKKSTGNSKYKRNSVFSFTYAPDSKNETTYTCYTAIFSQVLYGVLILASIIVIVIYRPRKN